MKVMIAEKKSQADEIAKAMGWKVSGDHYAGSLEGDDVRLVWARGHLLTLLEPQEVKEDISWNDPNSLLPIPKNFATKITEDKKIKGAKNFKSTKEYFETIKKHVKSANEVIIATDPDREGESIGWQVLEKLNYKGKIRRAWFASGLDSAGIKKALSNIKDGSETKSWFRASEARQRSDWAFQFLVRAYTYYAGYGGFGKHLGSGYGRESVVSVGRVQTPALRLIVERDREIENFVPKDHFEFNGDFEINKGMVSASYDPIIDEAVIARATAGVTWEPSKVIPKDGDKAPLDKPLFTGKKECDDFSKRLQAASDKGRVSSFNKKMTKKSAPPLFDSLSILGELNKAHGLPASVAQKTIESLYQKGLISYPRTAHKEIPFSMYSPSERNPVFNHLSKIPELSSQARHAQGIHDGKNTNVAAFKPSCFSSKPMEHHGLVPTHKGADLGSLSKEERAAYLMIAKRYVQAFYPPAAIEVQELVINVPVVDLLGHDSSRFYAKSEVVVSKGWMDAFPGNRKDKEPLKTAQEGDKAKLVELHVESKTTTPPPRYNDRTILVAMDNVGKNVKDPKLRAILQDKNGIGTPATRPQIIETLKVRGYIAYEGRSIISQPKGRDLIDRVPDDLSSPEMTALWEVKLDEVEKASTDSDSVRRRDLFVDGQVEMITKLILNSKAEMRGKLSDKRVNNPFSADARYGGKPSPKMVNAVKVIASAKGLKVDRGVTSDMEKCKAWLDQHSPKEGEVLPPSEAMIKFAKSLAEQSGAEVPENVLTDRGACKQYIEDQKKAAGPRKPSDRMIEVVKSIEEKKGVEAPKKVFEDFDACSKFLSEHLPKGKFGGNKKGFKKYPAKSAGGSPSKKAPSKKSPTKKTASKKRTPSGFGK